MKLLKSFLLFIGFLAIQSCGYSQKSVKEVEMLTGEMPKVAKKKSEYNQLNSKEKYVMLEQGTERAFTGQYHNLKKEGIYLCKQCNQPLFKSEDKFDSRSGWPSFDDMIKGAVTERPDPDGYRTEIICSNCKGHLGHVFRNEGFTDKNTRHCVNSVSLQFYSTSNKQN